MPVVLDFRFDFVERALACRCDRGDVIPDIAAVGVDRIVVDADIGGERSLNHVGAVGNIRERLAVSITPGPVHFVCGHRQLQLGRGFFNCAAAGSIVLDLVVQASHLGLGAFERDVRPKLLRGFGKGLRRFRDDLQHRDERGPESCLYWRADFAFLQREGRICDRRLHDA